MSRQWTVEIEGKEYRVEVKYATNITHPDVLYLKIESLLLGSEPMPFLVFSFFEPYKEAIIDTFPF